MQCTKQREREEFDGLCGGGLEKWRGLNRGGKNGSS